MWSPPCVILIAYAPVILTFCSATSVASAISPYGYIPSSTICIIFIVLFTVSTGACLVVDFRPCDLNRTHAAIHVGQAIRFRTYWLIPTAVLAGTGELIGWFGRVWSSQNVCTDGFLMQSVVVPYGHVNYVLMLACLEYL
jgi:hypothetical protein